MRLRPLPAQSEIICSQVFAPPRLVAHLMLVHDVACKLTENLQHTWPELVFDSNLVKLGASLHDIGKALYPQELMQAGNCHETRGEQLLLNLGLPKRVARVARTHAAWRTDAALDLEDLLVALADTCWKGARHSELEDLVTKKIAAAINQEPWAVFLSLDETLQELAADADTRLAWQAQFPVELPCG